VGLGALHMRFNARDLDFERLDALVKLLDREGIEVLSGERDERVLGLARK